MGLMLIIAGGIVLAVLVLGLIAQPSSPPIKPPLPPPPGSWDLSKPPGDRFRPLD